VENEKIVIKGKFKINKSALAKKLIVPISFLFFAFLFFSLAMKLKDDRDILSLIGFFGIFLFTFVFGIIELFKAFFIGFYKIELYENEIKLKDSFFKTKTIKYDDVIDFDTAFDDFTVSTEEKVYSFPMPENAFEISGAIRKKLIEIEKNRTLKLGEEEKNYKSKKKKMIFGILVECFIIILFFCWNFVCYWLTDGKDVADFSSYEKKIVLIFLVTEAILFISVLLFAEVGGKAVRRYKIAKRRYSEALSILYIERELPEKTVRIIRTFNSGRIVVYQSDSGAYKCSHEMFILKTKTWYSFMLSDSYQILWEIEEHLGNFKEEFVD